MTVSSDSSSKISCRRLHSVNWLYPPAIPLLIDWVCPSGSREPEEDDQEVAFPGGERWGPERQTTPVPESPAGGRVPSEPPQQLPCSAPAGPDMGWANHCPNIRFAHWHPKNKHLQWQCGTWQNWGVLQSMESHEVQCIKDHYLELVVRESIMRSLKGAVADMACYMGPTTGVSEILEKLLVIFGTVASFDMLMQNFYKISQGVAKKCLHSWPGWRAL